MKKYKITVNGRTYEVEVEEIGGSLRASAPVQAQPAHPVVAPRTSQPAASNAVREATPQTQDGSKELMRSPLPGVIVTVLASPGKSFARGDILLKIEAMKMENEILAPYDCTVDEVFVTPAKTVRTGDPLVKIATK